jgi:hypothetical protein
MLQLLMGVPGLVVTRFWSGRRRGRSFLRSLRAGVRYYAQARGGARLEVTILLPSDAEALAKDFAAVGADLRAAFERRGPPNVEGQAASEAGAR